VRARREIHWKWQDNPFPGACPRKHATSHGNRYVTVGPAFAPSLGSTSAMDCALAVSVNVFDPQHDCSVQRHIPAFFD
jgi:hypothetical protein